MSKRLLLLALVFAPLVHAAEPSSQDLFHAETAGYATYRIPGLVVTKAGTILAYCEARKSAKSDWGAIDVLLRRSTDGGATFAAPSKLSTEAPTVDADAVAKQGGITFNNPLAIADPKSGVVHFLYCAMYARCYYLRSDDDGQTFSKPVDITAAFEELRPRFDWKVIATGPGHGIRLSTGRLLVPVWLALRHEHRPSCVSTIYSDDDGRTWHAGEIIVAHTPETPNPSETAAVELADGRVMLNIRNESPRHRRLVTTSKDGATGWSKPQFDDALVDPICMASMIRSGDDLIFSNPAGDGRTKARTNLTLRLSPDSGVTWPHHRVLDEGIAAYSDLALTTESKLLCLYEHGGVDGRATNTATLRLTTLDVSWIN